MGVKEITEFVIRARQQGYAAGNEETIAPGTKQVEYREGNYLYRDVWVGQTRFHGWEVVTIGTEPVWGMVYSGGMSQHRQFPGPSSHEVYEFLKEALLARVSSARFGSEVVSYQKGDLIYEDSGRNLGYTFEGIESISHDNEVYFLRYCGGPIAMI